MDIRKEPFYRRENVFLIGVDDPLTLRGFIDGDYLNIDESIIKKYDSNYFFDAILNEEYLWDKPNLKA